MRKVLVVDDEKWIRRGLIQLIPWESCGLELAGEAADGQDAYELALALRPDLLFLDMRMPGLGGKELLGMLRCALPSLVTIVVSGYSDFEYTKEAIRHRAFDYLLKPVKKEDLAAVLEKALAELEAREAAGDSGSGAEPAEAWLREALAERPRGEAAADGEARPPAGWTTGGCVVFAARADAYRDDLPDGAAIAASARERLLQARAFHFGGDWSLALSPGPDDRGELVGAIGYPRAEAAGLGQALAEVQARLGEAAGTGMSLGAAGAEALRPQALQAALRAAREALGGRRLGEAGALRCAEAAAERPEPAAPYPQERERAFLLALALGEPGAAREELRRLLAELAADGTTVERMQRSAVLLVHAIERQLEQAGSSLEAMCGRSPQSYADRIRQRSDRASVSALFEEEIVPGVLACGRSGAKQGERLVRDIQKLIEDHYDQPLSLHHIAESRFVNADYLSRLFKKATGQTFVDYLTDYRIRQSLELMKISAYKNYEIARMVGYDDYRYFSQIFKKKTGKTIGEHRAASAGASP